MTRPSPVILTTWKHARLDGGGEILELVLPGEFLVGRGALLSIIGDEAGGDGTLDLALYDPENPERRDREQIWLVREKVFRHVMTGTKNIIGCYITIAVSSHELM